MHDNDDPQPPALPTGDHRAFEAATAWVYHDGTRLALFATATGSAGEWLASDDPVDVRKWR